MKRCKLFPTTRILSVNIPKNKEYLADSGLYTINNNSSTLQSASTKDSIKRKEVLKLLILDGKYKRYFHHLHDNDAKSKSRNKSKVILFKKKCLNTSSNAINRRFNKSQSSKFSSSIDCQQYCDCISVEDNRLNDFLDKQIKFQQLKTDILLLNQKDKYSSSTIWGKENETQNSLFLRKLKSNDLFKSKYQYDKQKLYYQKHYDNKRTQSSTQRNNYFFNNINNIHREASQHSRQLSKEINSEKSLSNILSTKSIHKRKQSKSNEVYNDISNTILCQSEYELIKNNEGKVQFYLDQNSKMILHQAVNTLIYKDRKTNKVDQILSNREAKAIVHHMNKEFKKIGTERTCLKKLLQLKSQNWKITEKEKMIKRIINYRIDYLENKYLKDECDKYKIVKTILPFAPNSIKYKNNVQ